MTKEEILEKIKETLIPYVESEYDRIFIIKSIEIYAKSYHQAEIAKLKEKVRGCKNLEPITPIDEGWDDAIDYVSGILKDTEEQQ